MKLVFVTSLVSTHYLGVRTKTRWSESTIL